MRRVVAPLALLFALAASIELSAQIDSLPSGGKGSFKDPAQKAAESYSRGAKAKRKAEEATDPKEKRKLYERAREELKRSAGYVSTYDALLALGQVDLALGAKKDAAWACAQAEALKPGDAVAQACSEEGNRPESAAPAAPATPPPPGDGKVSPLLPLVEKS